MSGRFLHRFVPADEPIGCFNAGLVAWYHPGPVLNLDGVVDHRAFEALRRGELDAYLDDQGVRLLIDHPVQFARDPIRPHASGLWFGREFDPERELREVARFDVPGVTAGRPGTDSFRLYWRVGRGAPPAPPQRPEILGRAPDGAYCALWPGRPGVTLSVGRDRDDAGELIVGDGATAHVLRIPVRSGPAFLWASDRDQPELSLPVR